MAKVTERKIVGLTVKYSDSSTSSYSLAEPLTEKSKTELREVVAELQKVVKDKGVSVVFGQTKQDKEHERHRRWNLTHPHH